MLGKKDVRHTQVLVVRALELRAPSVENRYLGRISVHANPLLMPFRMIIGDWLNRFQISDENLVT
jgi:hypothetical protein